MPAPASLDGRVALITGANTGIGLVSARELARRGAEVFIACRSPERAARARQDIRRATGRDVQLLELDLGDLESVRRCASEFLARGTPLHMLINNAGLAGKRGVTRSGFEMAFGVNHVGHFLLTHLLIYTEIWREVPGFLRPFLRLRSTGSLEAGAETTLHCATTPELAQQTGLYYDACEPKLPSSAARDAALAAELWRRTMAWVML